MEGRTFFAASGDNGSSCTRRLPRRQRRRQRGRAADLRPGQRALRHRRRRHRPVLRRRRSPAGRAVEKAWEYSGGNASPFIDAPDYQKDVPNLNRPCVCDANGQPTNTGKLCRGVPDVAALSGDVVSNGYTIVSDGKDSGGGGTSLSSPLWAGMWARVVGAAPSGTTGYGMANDALYKIAKDPARNGESFFDITLGANGLNPALPGYDYVTGLGVPKVSGLLKNVPAVAPARAATAAKGDTCRDQVAPVSRFTVSKSRLTRRGASLRGTSSDRGCGPARKGAAEPRRRLDRPRDRQALQVPQGQREVRADDELQAHGLPAGQGHHAVDVHASRPACPAGSTRSTCGASTPPPTTSASYARGTSCACA